MKENNLLGLHMCEACHPKQCSGTTQRNLMEWDVSEVLECVGHIHSYASLMLMYGKNTFIQTYKYYIIITLQLKQIQILDY